MTDDEKEVAFQMKLEKAKRIFDSPCFMEDLGNGYRYEINRVLPDDPYGRKPGYDARVWETEGHTDSGDRFYQWLVDPYPSCAVAAHAARELVRMRLS